ncbi:hypothetical protein GGX14DRAFT_558408 [Mycena pura]|uniref:DUF6534 domain-containing protein n=1 Tax=Mycena pura TaxID=153505 RepID=A0AAD6YKU7_9AGAR|nr:hypothetical protein GGX14DRAFT_558408 [Mycena pura]
MSEASFYPPGYIDAVGKPIMIGFMLSSPLYAIVIGQVIYYFHAFPKDRISVKLVVVFLLLVDTVHTVLLITGFNRWYLDMFLSPTLPKELAIIPLITHITIFTCQMTYAARIWVGEAYYLAEPINITDANSSQSPVSGKNKFATGVVVCWVATSESSTINKAAFKLILSSAQIGECFRLSVLFEKLANLGWNTVAGFIMGISTYVTSQTIVVYADPTFRRSGVVELSSSLACDVAIMVFMVYFLKGPGRGTSFDKTTNLVNKLLVYIISVGVLTRCIIPSFTNVDTNNNFIPSAATVANLALWLALTFSFDFMILHFIMGKLYSNSLLVMLNSRVRLREELYDTTAGIELSGTSRGTLANSKNTTTTSKHTTNSQG